MPTYDPNDPKHALIQTPEDWQQIDDPDKRVFFVAPGSYGDVTIQSSGTPMEPRILTLWRDDGAHPGRLAPEEQANVSLTFTGGAGNWIVSRLSSLSPSATSAFLVQPGSHDIVFDRMHVRDFEMAFRIVTSANAETMRITIQRSRIDEMTPSAIDNDRVAIVMGTEPWNGSGTLRDIHILENEIHNANDGIQPVRHNTQPLQASRSDPGLLIDCNHIYVDEAVYTDGQGKPTPDPDAMWAWTENAIDVKVGSDDPTNPVRITRNKTWGYRRTDTNGGGSGSWGSAIDIHFNVQNIIVRENVVFDCSRGIGIADPGGLGWAAQNVEVERNIFTDIGKDPNATDFALFIYDTNGATVRYNTFVGDTATPLPTYWFGTQPSTTGLTLSCNVAVSSVGLAGQVPANAVVQDNYHYATPRKDPSDGIEFPAPEDAQLEELTFWTDLYTPTPRMITVPGVVTTPQSPHADWCGAGP